MYRTGPINNVILLLSMFLINTFNPFQSVVPTPKQIPYLLICRKITNNLKFLGQKLTVILICLFSTIFVIFGVWCLILDWLILCSTFYMYITSRFSLFFLSVTFQLNRCSRINNIEYCRCISCRLPKPFHINNRQFCHSSVASFHNIETSLRCISLVVNHITLWDNQHRVICSPGGEFLYMTVVFFFTLHWNVCCFTASSAMLLATL